MLRQHTKQHFKRGLSGIMAAVMTATLIPSLSVLADDEIKTVNYSFLSNTFKVEQLLILTAISTVIQI